MDDPIHQQFTDEELRAIVVLDEEACDAMVETGTVLVPTRFIIHVLLAVGREQGVPPHADAQARGDRERPADARAAGPGRRHPRGRQDRRRDHRRRRPAPRHLAARDDANVSGVWKAGVRVKG